MMLSRKQIIGIIVSIVVVILVVYGISVTVIKPKDPYAGLVTEMPTDFDEATREYFEERLATTEAAIKAQEDAGGKVDLNLYLSAASDAYALGHLATAREMLEKQLAGNSINYVAWNNYALVLEDMKEYDNAEDAFKKTLELESAVEKYYEDYADFLLAHRPEEQDELKALYETNLSHFGQTVWNMVGLGDWYAANGDCARAQDHYEVAVALAPDNQALKDDFTKLKSTCRK